MVGWFLRGEGIPRHAPWGAEDYCPQELYRVLSKCKRLEEQCHSGVMVPCEEQQAQSDDRHNQGVIAVEMMVEGADKTRVRCSWGRVAL